MKVPASAFFFATDNYLKLVRILIYMEKERVQRYRQKINFVTEKITDLPKKIDTHLTIDATLYRVQTTIEASMDLVAMLAKDKGKDVGDDYENIHKLEKLAVITPSFGKKLASLNGLRNAIVHKYNSFEEKTVAQNIVAIKNYTCSFRGC